MGIMAAILITQTLSRPSMADAHTVNVLSLVLAGVLIGLAVGLLIPGLRNPK